MKKGKLKRIATALVLAFSCAFVMSGCEIIIQQDLVIEKDGSGTFTVRQLLDDEAVDYSDGNYKKFEFNDDTYYTDKDENEVEEFEDIEELQELLEDMEFMTDLKVSTRGISATLNPKKYLNNASDSEMDDYEEYAEFIGVAFCITFPYKVVDTNGDLSEDGKTVTWEYKFSDKKFEIYAKCSNPLVPILITAGCVVFLGAAAAVVIILVVKNNKKKASGALDNGVPQQFVPVNPAAASVPETAATSAPLKQDDSFSAENPNDSPFDF